MPDFSLEDAYEGIVVGIDEAGRGPWAGPVVASCVLLNRDALPEGINDSKKLSKAKREEIFKAIHESAHVGVGIASVEEIDELNILHATYLAMQRAYETLHQLDFTINAVLVDGNKAPPFPCNNVQTVIGGDRLSLNIAAASIIAKVTRDNMMAKLAEAYPGYGWERNAGYGTKDHQSGLRDYGVTPHHRKSYAPIRKLLKTQA